MNNYEDWAHLVAKKLKGEADVITAIGKDELDDAAATNAFVNTVLQPFLPENFGIGEGHIIDAYGRRSAHFDAIVYNRSFPRIQFGGTQPDYLYESVLAAFSIRAKYVRKTFFESMDACASLAKLETKTDNNVLIQLAKRNGLKPGPNKSFVHEDPLRTTRFELIGKPPAFMFGFTGIKGSLRLLQENLELWIDNRQQESLDTPMQVFPAVIATQGCFAWRNAAPLALNNREMLGLGMDAAPIRLIILQLLHLLNRRLNVNADGFGLKPNLGSYLSQFSPPAFELGVGDIDQLVTLRAKSSGGKKTPQSKSAKAHAAEVEKPAKSEKEASPKTTAQAEPATQAVKKAAAKAAAVSSSEKTGSATNDSSAGVFDKPSPFASAPKPATEPEKEPTSPARQSAAATSLGSAPIPSTDDSLESQPPAKPPAAPLGSAPIPSAEEEPGLEPPVAPLGSAPIPSMEPEEPAAAPAKPTQPALGSAPIPMAESSLPKADIIPPKPPVDIELTGENELPDLGQLDELPALDQVDDLPDLDQADELPDFESTMIIAPDASQSSKKPAESTNAFIDRVKQQLANGEALPENEKEEDPFISTVPH